MKDRIGLTKFLIVAGVLTLLAGGAGFAQSGEVIEMRKVVKDSGEEPDHGWLGVLLTQKVEERTVGDKKERVDSGIEIIDVFEDSAAEEGGLQKGDVIVKIDGRKVTEVGEAVDYLKGKDVGDRVRIRVDRDGKERTFRIVLGERPADMKQVIARLVVVHKLWRQFRESVRAERRTAVHPPASEAAQTTEDDA